MTVVAVLESVSLLAVGHAVLVLVALAVVPRDRRPSSALAWILLLPS